MPGGHRSGPSPATAVPRAAAAGGGQPRSAPVEPVGAGRTVPAEPAPDRPVPDPIVPGRTDWGRTGWDRTACATAGAGQATAPGGGPTYVERAREVWGKSVSVRVDLGGPRFMKKTKK